MGSPNKRNESQPWLDPNGRVYSDDALREISKTWDQDTWSRFLDATVDTSNETEAEKYETARHGLAAYIRRLMRDHLTPQQQQVLRMIFWENLPEREIAEILGVTKGRVPTIKRESLNKLRGLLETRVGKFPLSRGTTQSTEGETQHEPTHWELHCEGIRRDLC